MHICICAFLSTWVILQYIFILQFKAIIHGFETESKLVL